VGLENEILKALRETAFRLEWEGDIEILLVGGVAAMQGVSGEN